MSARDDYEDSTTDGFSSHETDIEEAKQCIEDSLSLLAYMGSDNKIDELQELLNRAFQLLDRSYGISIEWDNERELDFDQEE